MNTLSQLDITSPDHISVITRDGKVTISVTKDGASVTLGFPVRNTFNTTPSTPLQQPCVAVKKYEGSLAPDYERGSRFTRKLTEAQVIELKQILGDKDLMSRFSSKTRAYKELGRMYGVSHARIAQIANGTGWTHVKPTPVN